ncbi:hypothetical protein HZH66_014155 [Vespula vulgaris]|uniref:Uncharacterized protein n=1 Tax=Vespula vulgaris TaxID=7454 RepID=A0A834MRA7_VESVU|nr:hypothetical protein HZH66_014155 [Vespula vulgaris]
MMTTVTTATTTTTTTKTKTTTKTTTTIVARLVPHVPAQEPTRRRSPPPKLDIQGERAPTADKFCLLSFDRFPKTRPRGRTESLSASYRDFQLKKESDDSSNSNSNSNSNNSNSNNNNSRTRITTATRIAMATTIEELCFLRYLPYGVKGPASSFLKDFCWMIPKKSYFPDILSRAPPKTRISSSFLSSKKLIYL